MKATKIEHVETILWDRWLLIKIHCEDGTIGIGEGGVHGWQRPTKTMVETMAPFLIGKDPSRIEHHYQWLYRSSHFMGSVVQGALSAIDIALWDIKGKRLAVPVYDLMGGMTRDRVAGLKVVTGGVPVYLDFENKLLRASVQQATLQLSEFLYLGGSFAFEAGPSHEVTVNSGMPPDILDLIEKEASGSPDIQEALDLLGLDLETGTLTHGVDSLSIGGSNVTAFAGVNGPYQLADVTVLSDRGRVMDKNPIPYITADYLAGDFSETTSPEEEVIFKHGFESQP